MIPRLINLFIYFLKVGGGGVEERGHNAHIRRKKQDDAPFERLSERNLTTLTLFRAI